MTDGQLQTATPERKLEREQGRILKPGHRLRRPAECVITLLAAAVYLGLLYVAVSVAIYLTTGFYSLSFTEAQVSEAMSGAAGASGGEGAFGLRLLVALLFCAGPVFLKAARVCHRRLSGAHLMRRDQMPSLLVRWAGVGLAVIAFGWLLAASGWPFTSLALIVVSFFLAERVMSGGCGALLERL